MKEQEDLLWIQMNKVRIKRDPPAAHTESRILCFSWGTPQILQRVRKITSFFWLLSFAACVPGRSMVWTCLFKDEESCLAGASASENLRPIRLLRWHPGDTNPLCGREIRNERSLTPLTPFKPVLIQTCQSWLLEATTNKKIAADLEFWRREKEEGPEPEAILHEICSSFIFPPFLLKLWLEICQSLISVQLGIWQG